MINPQNVYSFIIENVISIIIIWDQEGNIDYVNEYGANLFGYQATELIEKNIKETILSSEDEYGNNLHKLLQEIAKNPNLFQDNENENTCKDGSKKWIHWKNSPIVKDGKVYILSVGNDITKKNELEKKNKIFMDIFEDNADHIVITDKFGNIEYVNKAFLKNLGYSKSDILGKTSSILASGKMDRSFFKTLWETISNKGVFRSVFINNSPYALNICFCKRRKRCMQGGFLSFS